MTEQALTSDFLNKALKVTLPPNIAARAGWKFDINSLVDACGLLELQKEVRLRFTSASDMVGGYRVKLDMESDPIKYYHGITISQDRPLDDANMTLWHELRHCWQAETYAKVSGKAVDSFNVVYKANDGPRGQSYKENKFELDARSFAARMVSEGRMLLLPRNR